MPQEGPGQRRSSHCCTHEIVARLACCSERYLIEATYQEPAWRAQLEDGYAGQGSAASPARADRTGHVAACITRRVVHPNMSRSKVPRPWTPITISLTPSRA